MRSRSEVVKIATSWLGKKESDGSFKVIIDTYNSFNGKLPRGIKMQYSWPWCACTWSAIAIALGYTDIMPIEISCGELIKKAKEMGCWQENDGYIPLPGDGILYDWDDDGCGDNTGWPDHIGVVDYVNKDSGYMTVIEGNYSDSVKKRSVLINGKYIRGFIVPKYTNVPIPNTKPTITKDVETVAREAIIGLWGNNPQRKEAFEKNGIDSKAVQAKINEILNTPSKNASSAPGIVTTCHAKYKDEKLAGSYKTTANLHCRNDAGTNKKSLCLIPKGTKVKTYGFYNVNGGFKWLLIQAVVYGITYVGFSHEKYLKKV